MTRKHRNRAASPDLLQGRGRRSRATEARRSGGGGEAGFDRREAGGIVGAFSNDGAKRKSRLRGLAA